MLMVKLTDTLYVNSGLGAVTHAEQAVIGDKACARVYFTGGEYVLLLEPLEPVIERLNSYTVDSTIKQECAESHGVDWDQSPA